MALSTVSASPPASLLRCQGGQVPESCSLPCLGRRRQVHAPAPASSVEVQIVGYAAAFLAGARLANRRFQCCSATRGIQSQLNRSNLKVELLSARDETASLVKEAVPSDDADEDEIKALAAAAADAAALVPTSNMGDHPEVKYGTDFAAMKAAFDSGDIHKALPACLDLLGRKPDDAEVWRVLTTANIRLKLYPEALEACERWLAFDPYSLNVRNAQAVCLAGCGRYGEARARFAALAREVVDIDPQMAKDLVDCQERVQELWLDQQPGIAQMSTRASFVVSGLKRPHIWLPNFADSIGPVKVLYSPDEGIGGGSSGSRKVVVTRDVEAGELLFVQQALVFGKVEDQEAVDGINRLEDALNIMVHLSPRAALLAEILDDRGSLDADNNIADVMSDKNIVREDGPWPLDPSAMDKHMEVCRRLVYDGAIATGFQLYGVWPLTSLMRHSCIPSANYVALGDTITVRACRDLKEGDEVTAAFFPTTARLEDRQEVATSLRGGFWCRCPRCEAEAKFEEKICSASDRVQAVREEMAGRMRALITAMDVQMDVERKREEREMQAWADKSNRTEVEGLQGLADRYPEMQRASLEEVERIAVEGMPEVEREPRLHVPADLIETLQTALDDFEREVSESDMSSTEKQWCRASHLPLFLDVMTLRRFMDDTPATTSLMEKILPILETVAPGSFLHQRTAVMAWEAAATIAVGEAQSAGREVTSEDICAEEREAVARCMQLRYGPDTPLLEQDGAMLRTANTRLEDENWFWRMDWVLGNSPDDPDIKPATRPSVAYNVRTAGQPTEPELLL
mmetsp:Transcript_15581/g.34911  ORF Transcript_15581/g.34911 Transcript_15581/m.34911 type:complete len:801 (-) Transcript_15581:34-2436(-)